jgi:hypothetical protein
VLLSCCVLLGRYIQVHVVQKAVLVRPTRISPRQSGAAGPRSTLASGVRGEARIVGYVLQSSSADRAESLGL